MNHTTQIRKGRKYDQVLEGARSVFLADGFERANVDDIARAAGVSKATLYSYFPDKRLLFVEFATAECLRQNEMIVDSIDMSAPPREVLGMGGRQFLSFVTSPLGMQMFRICVAESERFPEVGQNFYLSGPRYMHDQMVGYLEGSVARGELVIDDLSLAAYQFGELCKADIWVKLCLNVRVDVSQDEIERNVDGAVDMFMARYGA
jgi:AcrR family transcriptional regulator